MPTKTKIRVTKQTRPILRDELRLQASRNVAVFHENRRNLDERAFYPPHDARKESPEYAKVHRDLVVKKNLPCLICGVTNQTLKDAKANPFGAKQMETHHHVIEWALANAIDPIKFNQRVLPHLRVRHPNNPDYAKEFSAEDVGAWVDHSPDNLWVLCDVHHRHKWFGIHEISDPIWGPQDLFYDDFNEAVQKALSESDSK